MEHILVILSPALSLAAIGLALFTYLRQRRSQVFVGTKDFNGSWQVFNQVLLNDDDFLRFEQELHPHGNLTREQIKRVYFYFMRFNVAYSAHLGAGELSGDLAESALNNEANLSFHDREFIKEHVFGRGYDWDFAQKFIKKWKKIETEQRTLAMRGDEKGEYTSQLRPDPRKNIREDQAGE